jgi:tetratricopeptide (TPR) repeat protein
MALHIAKTYSELIGEANEAERAGEQEKAVSLYERAVKLEPHDELPYNRLMILYRKLRRYEDELALINKGIATFETFYKKKSEKLFEKHKSVQALSKSLAKSLGLKDNKGADIYHPEPIDKWLKRKEVVERKLGLRPSIKKAANKKAAKPAKKAASKKAAKKAPSKTTKKATKRTTNRK